MTKKNASKDFWIIAPYGWGSEEDFIRVQKDVASTALKALNHAIDHEYATPSGYYIRDFESYTGYEEVFVYEAKEVGTYVKTAWRKV